MAFSVCFICMRSDVGLFTTYSETGPGLYLVVGQVIHYRGLALCDQWPYTCADQWPQIVNTYYTFLPTLEYTNILPITEHGMLWPNFVFLQTMRVVKKHQQCGPARRWGELYCNFLYGVVCKNSKVCALFTRWMFHHKLGMLLALIRKKQVYSLAICNFIVTSTESLTVTCVGTWYLFAIVS